MDVFLWIERAVFLGLATYRIGYIGYTDQLMYPPVIKRGWLGNPDQNGNFNGKIMEPNG